MMPRLLAAFVLFTASITPAVSADPARQRDDSAVPGVVIRHTPASSRIYVGSPSICRLPNGSLLASCDEFGKGSTEHVSAVSHVFRSDDGGASWHETARLDRLFWASLFNVGDAAYLLGTTKHHGLLNIRRSTDGGNTWTTPTNEANGLLTPTGEYHTAPVPVVERGGKLWRAVEDASNGDAWGYRYSAMVISADTQADLLRRDAWTFTNMIQRDASWLDGNFKAFLEGNVVTEPGGRLVNMLRVQQEDGGGGIAAVCHVSDAGQQLTFDPNSGFRPLPGAAKKFFIRFDPVSRRYWALVNAVPPTVATGRGPGEVDAGSVRNTLVLMASDDLITWEIRCVLLHHPDMVHVGFQYPSWLADGDDLLATVRTAYPDGLGGAKRAHDANYMTFHRFKNFRNLTMGDSVVDPATLGW